MRAQGGSNKLPREVDRSNGYLRGQGVLVANWGRSWERWLRKLVPGFLTAVPLIENEKTSGSTENRVKRVRKALLFNIAWRHFKAAPR